MENQVNQTEQNPNESIHQKFMDLRKVLEEDNLLEFSAYLEGTSIIITVFTFDVPLKQIKLQMGELPDEEIEKFITNLEEIL